MLPFKVGPDFIDPGHHKTITGVNSRNLDGWMLSKDYNTANLKKNSQGADIAVVEGVMGLFDGYSGKTEDGSTAQMAKWLGFPVVLVVDAKSMARSVAALVKGFECFDRQLKFAGVIFNNIAGERHLTYLQDAIEHNVAMPCIGGIPRNENISIPERHLGLVTAQDHPLSKNNVENLAAIIEDNINMDALLDSIDDAVVLPDKNTSLHKAQKPVVNIGVAKDNAFCFYYKDNIELLEYYGAKIVYFSPVHDQDIPQDLDGIYFGGGYPELYAKTLSDNVSVRNHILNKSSQGMPMYGECGGFMYLCSQLCDKNGNVFAMTGCLPFKTSMLPKLNALGYREITLQNDTIIGKKGYMIKGHEFHYSQMTPCVHNGNIKTVYQVSKRTGLNKNSEGFQIKRCLGSYIHLHFGSCPDVARHFVETCLVYKKERGAIQ